MIEAFLHIHFDTVPLEFPERIERLAASIALWGAKTNLTAHPENPDAIAFHVIDSIMPLVLAPTEQSHLAGAFDSDRKILDVGSGAGFPGLVLAAASLANFTLVEARRKRASFLQIAVAEMGLKNVTIEPRRAEDIGLTGQFDLVTARAFGVASDFLALAERALKPGGLAMLYANPSQRIRLDQALKSYLADYRLIEYRIPRGGENVERMLALWRRK